MDELIVLNNISKIYNEGLSGEVRALNDVSLTVKNGEFVTILGQSGSGKSTLMNILGCLDIPTYGSYYLNGELVSNMKKSKLSIIRNRQIGFVFQGFNLIPGLNAIENVELPLIYRGMNGKKRRELALAALDRVGLSARVRHYPGEMSGGQQQRVAIARAIACSPPVIMADEPTGNLDSKSGTEIMKWLAELNNNGSTIILITHDNTLAHLAKRIVTIKDGKLIQDIAVTEQERAEGWEKRCTI